MSSSPPIKLIATVGTNDGKSTTCCPDTWLNPFNIGVGCVVTSGSPTYNVEHTFNDIWAGETLVWFINSGISGATANANGNYAYPVSGIRVNITGGTGSVTCYIRQAGTR